MDKFSFKRIGQGELRGWVREDLIHLLPPNFFEDPASFIKERHGRVIKESRLRWAAIFSLPEGERVFIKRDKTQGWAEALKFILLPSKARKEWLIATRLQKKNLPVPKPLGWIERGRWGLVKDSWYLSEALGGGGSLIDILPLKREVPIGPLAKMVRVFHDAGLFHKDLHGGNLLWDGESFFLTDLHRAEILRSLSLDQRLRNLSQLFHSLRSQWGKEDYIRFLDAYFAGDSLDSRKKETLFQRVLSLMDQLQKRWQKSRTKRCLQESTEFTIKKEEGITAYLRRDFPLDQLKEVLQKHAVLIRENPARLLKQAPETNVSLLDTGYGKICVKQFRYPHRMDRLKENFRNSKGLKAWIAGNGLKIRGIPSPKVMAFVEIRNGFGLKESFLLMEALEKGQELDRYLIKGFGSFERKRIFVRDFARWFSRFHQMDVYHGDMKTCNVLVSEEGEGWRFYLLDLEDVRLDQPVDGKRLFKNFLQLNTSTPRSITYPDRIRFYREYQRFRPVIRDDRTFLYKLIQQSKERGIVYVSPQGVVEEKWL
jgi:tRNA A-37 threonylcarbamoyl transferase component Bud32